MIVRGASATIKSNGFIKSTKSWYLIYSTNLEVIKATNCIKIRKVKMFVE